MKIVVTGGHLTPALAVIDVLKKRKPEVEIHFFGRMHTREGDHSVSSEYTIAKERGFYFYPIVTGRLQREFTIHTIPSLLKIPFGFIQSFYYLLKVRPDKIVSFGGYLAVPVVIAGKILGVPIISHEQTLVPGLANQIISRFVDVLALSFEETKKYYSSTNSIVTGNPIRQEVFEQKGKFVIDRKGLPVLYVTGGNQGSHIINQTIFELLPKLLERMHVIHQTGNSRMFDDHQRSQKLQTELIGKYPGSYFAYDYINSDMIGDVFNQSNLVISRAGANTLCELLALGKKAILIPIPKTSNDEQNKNAIFFERSGLGVSLDQNIMTADLLFQTVLEVLERTTDLDMINNARALVKTDAAEHVADVVLSTV